MAITAAIRIISITAIINNICNIASLKDVEAITLTMGSHKKNNLPNLGRLFKKGGGQLCSQTFYQKRYGKYSFKKKYVFVQLGPNIS